MGNVGKRGRKELMDQKIIEKPSAEGMTKLSVTEQADETYLIENMKTKIS